VAILPTSHPVHGFSISRELNSLLHLLSNEEKEALGHFFMVYLTTFTGVELTNIALKRMWKEAVVA
jgi:hypothetical protein